MGRTLDEGRAVSLTHKKWKSNDIVGANSIVVLMDCIDWFIDD